MFERNNTASALTRKARKELSGRVESVTVKSQSIRGNASGEVSADEIESLMSARQILIDAGIQCSAIHTEYKALQKCFYIGFQKGVSA